MASSDRCADGHAPLVAGRPRDLGGCVNINHRCPRCRRVCVVESWRKDAWLTRPRPRRPTPRARPVQTTLPFSTEVDHGTD